MFVNGRFATNSGTTPPQVVTPHNLRTKDIVVYLHYTSRDHAQRIVATKELWPTSFHIGHNSLIGRTVDDTNPGADHNFTVGLVYGCHIGNTYNCPQVQQTKLGRTNQRPVAVIFDTWPPDTIRESEVVWHTDTPETPLPIEPIAVIDTQTAQHHLLLADDDADEFPLHTQLQTA